MSGIRAHAVDRHELLGEGVGRCDDWCPTRDAAHHRSRETEDVLELIAREPVPVGVHRLVGDRIRQNRRRPFHGVDFGDESNVDQAGLAVQLFVAPIGMVRLQHFADGVVLGDEQAVEHAQADPAIVFEAGQLFSRGGVDQHLAVGADLEFAVHERAHLRGSSGVGAIQLRGVPPVGVVVDEGGRMRGPGGSGRDLALGDRHRVVRPGIAGGDGDFVLFGGLAVDEPVVHHELNPGGGQRFRKPAG